MRDVTAEMAQMKIAAAPRAQEAASLVSSDALITVAVLTSAKDVTEDETAEMVQMRTAATIQILAVVGLVSSDVMMEVVV